ncbi:MAG: hypothetical protein WCV68_00250 [Candidatus Paceibacterota bacterium]
MRESISNFDDQMDLPFDREEAAPPVLPEPVLSESIPLDYYCPQCDIGADCGRSDCPQSLARRERLEEEKRFISKKRTKRKKAA